MYAGCNSNAHCTTIWNHGLVKVLVKTSQVKGQAMLIKVESTCYINTDIMNCMGYGDNDMLDSFIFTFTVAGCRSQ